MLGWERRWEETRESREDEEEEIGGEGGDGSNSRRWWKVSVAGGVHRGEERNVRKIELRKMKEGRVRGWPNLGHLATN